MKTSSINVLHINDSDRFGGSGRSGYRIHTGLKKLGLRSRMLVGHKSATDADVRLIWDRHLRPFDRLSYHIFERLSLQYLFYPSSFLLIYDKWFREADVLQLFNTHGNYFSHTALPLLSRKRPIVWRLSDMWPLTGHCTHSFDCERWKTGCGSCPILSDYPPLRWDTTALLWKIKNLTYAHSRIHIVAPSKWIADIALQSPLLGRFPIHHIPNGIDTSVFHPIPKERARESINVDPSKKVILFSSHLIKNLHKGRVQIQEALERLRLAFDVDNTLLLVVGRGSEEWKPNLPFVTKMLPHISDDRQLAAVYSAADVFVLPSLADNSPNAVLESMACGTPPITFNVGGCPELVQHMETGYLAAYNDSGDLAEGIRRLVQDSELRNRLAQRALRVIDDEYTWGIEARRFKKLYEQILSKGIVDPVVTTPET